MTYECNSRANNLLWRVLDSNGVQFDQTSSFGFGDVAGGSEFIGANNEFNAILINSTDPYGSNITFTADSSFNNYVVQCGLSNGQMLVNCSIMITTGIIIH